MSQTESRIRLVFDGAERGVAAAAAKAGAAVRRLKDDVDQTGRSSDAFSVKATGLASKLGTVGLYAGAAGAALGAGAAAVGAAVPVVGALALGFGVASAAIGGSKEALEEHSKAMAEGKGDFAEYNKMLAKMTPEQREFTKAVVATKAPLSDLQKTAGRSFLPGVTKFLHDAPALFPILDRAVGRTGTIMGETAGKLGDLFKSDEFKRNLDGLLKGTEPVTRAIGDSFVRLTDRVIKFGAEMAPAGEGFATFLDDATAGLEGFFDGLAPHAGDFKSIWESVGSILRDVLPIVGELAGEMSAQLAPILRDVAGFIRENQDAISAWVPFIGQAVVALAGLKIAASVAGWVGGAAGALFSFGEKAAGAGGKVGGFVTKVGLLKGLGAAVAIGAIAVELDKVNAAAAGGEANLSGWDENLNDIVRAGKQLFDGDFAGIFADIGREVGVLSSKWDEGNAPIQRWAATVGQSAQQANRDIENFFRGLVGMPPLPPIPIDANTAPATGKVDDWKGGVSRARGTAQFDANPALANAALGGWRSSAGATVATARLNANPGQANTARSGWQSAANSTVGTARLNANPGQANATLGGWRGSANTTVGTARLNANTGAATSAVNDWRRWANGLVVTIRAVLSKIGFALGGPVLPGMAAGGPITGPGSGTDDRAGMFALSAGEWVMTAKQVDNAGGFGGMARLAAALDRGRQLGLAEGGPVKWGSVSDAKWKELKAAGWKGRAGDNMEALYRPAMKTPSSAHPASGRGRVEVRFVGNTDSALATLIMRMIREDKIKLKAA